MVWRSVLALVLAAAGQGAALGETVRLKATADIWVSDAVAKERNTSSGKCSRLKLKTIQEMSAIRLDASPAKGREVLEATLFLRRAGRDQLRYIRVSTVNGDWVEGNGTRPYGPADGATFLFADGRTKKPWAWPGSQFCDVILGSGHSITAWAECRKLPNGWVSLPLPPAFVRAMVCGDTDGLAIQDGGDLEYFNNFLHSVQSRGSEPYIEVELGRPLTAVPALPTVHARPAHERPLPDARVLRVSIEEAKDVFCWRLTLDGRPVERWRVAHPAPKGATVFYLEDLPLAVKYTLQVTAVSPGGAASPTMTVHVHSRAEAPPPPTLRKLAPPELGKERLEPGGRFRVWACPPLVKINPGTGQAMFGEMGDDVDYRQGNAVWDSRRIRLFGARGETVSYQLVVTNLRGKSLANITVMPEGFTGPAGSVLPKSRTELFRNWPARNKDGKWQPAYCVPLAAGAAFSIPDPLRKLPGETTQSVTVEVTIPKGAPPGRYTGTVSVRAEGVGSGIPVLLDVLDFVLPDRLSFWPELNAYRIPKNAHACWRLAHEHRCVANYWKLEPDLRGSGKGIQVVWDRYDRDVGPLLSGDAFKTCKRAGQPVEVMYLPFEDSWPTPLTKQTYNYQGHWPKRGDDRKWLIQHYRTAPFIGDALSRDYKAAFLAVQRQFIEHFKAKGWSRTEMQCFYGGKNTHRIQYGSNMWWTTDEPYHWADWLALQFFCKLWTQGRGAADPRRWAARADISRPQWQGQTLDGIVDTVYFGTGSFSSPAMYRRCRTLARQAPLDLRSYGSANRDNESNTGSVVWCLNAWLHGARAVLPWQTLGSDKALDVNDAGAGGGNALIVPGDRFGVPVVADLRLKALRDGQQLVEYLVELGKRRKLSRAQLRRMVSGTIRLETGARAGTGLDNADALQFGALEAWQIAGLRRALADLIVSK